MNKEYDGVEALQYNLSLADQWLAGMAEGAQRSVTALHPRAPRAAAVPRFAFLPPAHALTSPHLSQSHTPTAFGAGVAHV